MINIETKVAGFYKFAVRKVLADGTLGEERVIADWFPNLILDAGLHRIGSSTTYMSHCQVGTGSTAPANNNTQLASYLASTNTVQSTTTGTSSASPYYGFLTRVFRFAAGAAAGNLSEVGVGWASTGSLFSRALILDGGGNPTTITVLSDEVLDVTYQIRAYANETDITGTIVLNGNSYNWTCRPSNVTTYDSITAWNLGYAQNESGSSTYNLCYDGAIGPITGIPSGISTNGAATTSVDVTYANDFIGKATDTWGLNDANFAAGIGAIWFRVGWGRYQVGFSPKIPKTNEQVLSLTFSHSWTRRT